MNVLCILLVWSVMGLNLMVQGSNNVLGQVADCFLPAVRSAMIKTAGDSCVLRDDKDQIVIRDEWLWAAPASQKMTAAYMVIENHGSTEIALISASSDASRVVELHKMELEDGFMRMHKIDSIQDPRWWHRRVKARWIPSDGDRSKQGTEGRRQGDHDASV